MPTKLVNKSKLRRTTGITLILALRRDKMVQPLVPVEISSATSFPFPTVEPQVRQMYRWLRSGSYGIRIGFVDEDGSHYKHYPLADSS